MYFLGYHQGKPPLDPDHFDHSVPGDHRVDQKLRYFKNLGLISNILEIKQKFIITYISHGSGMNK